MAKYGSKATYGSGVHYGADAYTGSRSVSWQILVDWDGDGTYDSTNEAYYLIDLKIDRGRANYLAPQGGGFEHVRPGTATLTFDNNNRRYDPRYTSSPLYPNVKPGRKIHISVTDLSSNTNYVVFTGVIDDIVPTLDPAFGTVQIECVDYLALMNDQEITLDEHRTNTTIRAAMVELLNDVGYPSTLRNLDTEGQPILIYEAIKTNAGQAIHELADAARGTFFVDRNGKATFYNRLHTYNVIAIFDESIVLNDPVLVQPWAEIYNHITCVAFRPIKRQPSIVWFLTDPAELPASIDVSYDKVFDPAVDSYTANSASDGSGTDITASTTVSASLGFTGGSVTASSGSAGYLTALEIRGCQMDTIEQNKKATDSTSISAYGKRRFVLRTPYLQDANYAQAHATAIKDFAKDDRESITIQIESRPDGQFVPELMDKITFTSATLDINKDYWVMGIKHEWTKDTGEGVLTTLVLSSIITAADSITASGWLTEPTQAPQGYEDPGGDAIATSGSTVATGAMVSDTISSIPTGLPYSPAFLTEVFDTGGFWSGGLLANRFTIMQAGIYSVGTYARFLLPTGANYKANGLIELVHYNMGDATVFSQYFQGFAETILSGGTSYRTFESIGGTILINASVGDYVTVTAQCTSVAWPGCSSPASFTLSAWSFWIAKL